MDGEPFLWLAQTFQMVSGTLRTERGTIPIEDGRLRGTEISFRAGDTHYTGSVDDTTMTGIAQTPSGAVDWSATPCSRWQAGNASSGTSAAATAATGTGSLSPGVEVADGDTVSLAQVPFQVHESLDDHLSLTLRFFHEYPPATSPHRGVPARETRSMRPSGTKVDDEKDV